MFKTIKKFFRIPTANFDQLIKDGATILDVRSNKEFASGHLKTSINIQLDKLSNNIDKLKDKQNPIIVCCASGIRSASAKRILKAKGFEHVYNAGSWTSLIKFIQ